MEYLGNFIGLLFYTIFISLHLAIFNGNGDEKNIDFIDTRFNEL